MQLDPSKIELPIYNADARFEVERQVSAARFGCDLSICKGACCVMPGALGAPILESEIAHLERALPIVEKYLPEAALEVIAKEGVWRRERDGSLTIPAINHADCVFVHYVDGIANCSIETAYRNEEIEGFPKPISCHLFPIRIYPERKRGHYYICYEEIDECSGGRVRGKKEDIPLLDFLETPLVRALGSDRIAMLRKLLEAE